MVKNKVAPPFKQVEFDIMYGEGISKVGELIDLGVKAGIVEKSGAWFSYDSQRLGQGRENAKAFLRDNPDIARRIETAIRQNAGLIAERILENADADGGRPRRGRGVRPDARRCPPGTAALRIGVAFRQTPCRSEIRRAQSLRFDCRANELVLWTLPSCRLKSG